MKPKNIISLNGGLMLMISRAILKVKNVKNLTHKNHWYKDIPWYKKWKSWCYFPLVPQKHFQTTPFQPPPSSVDHDVLTHIPPGNLNDC